MSQTRYKRYLLGMLLTILAFNFVDRLALGLVLQDVKSDLQLSDTQLGFLSGMAFALFYSLMGIPIARWADRGNRIFIIASTTAVWSAAVALCGAAENYTQLLLIRVVVAVGEAGCVPPAHSLIADYFDRSERPRALAIYTLGGSLSNVVGYLAAGWINELIGWRSMFVLIGLPGLVLALLAWLTLREPRRSPDAGESVARRHVTDASAPGLRQVWTTLLSNRTFVHLLVSISIVYLFGYGILQWQPAFFVRSYHMDTGELGTWFAMIYGLGGVIGAYCGGELAARRAARNERLQLRAMVVVYILFGVVSAFIYLASSWQVAFALMAVSAIGGAAVSGPLFATIQSLVPAKMRATAIALVFLFANLIGMGLGPLAAGVLSDALSGVMGDEALRYSLLALCPGYFWAAWHMWRASRTVTRDVLAAPSEMEPDGVGVSDRAKVQASTA